MAKTKLQVFVETFNWVNNDDIPFTKLNKQLKDCTVAVVTTAGVYVHGDQPFDITNREDVDETYREIPTVTANSELRLGHEHFNKRFANEDINVVFPIDRLKALVDQGFINGVADSNFSITGYIPKPEKIYDTGRQIAKRMAELAVDIALIVPV